jgi:hypothetical protein
MNTLNLSLSSNSSSYSETIPLYIEDYTELSISFGKIFDDILPLYIKIVWGDGKITIEQNNIFETGRENSHLLNPNPVFTKTYTHEFFPSGSSLYKLLSAYVYVEYSNGDQSIFTLPITIRTYDVFDSLEDIKILNCNLIDGNKIEYQLLSKNGIIEIYTK